MSSRASSLTPSSDVASHSTSRASPKRRLSRASCHVTRSVAAGEKLPYSRVDTVSAFGLNVRPGARDDVDASVSARSASRVSARPARAERVERFSAAMIAITRWLPGMTANVAGDVAAPPEASASESARISASAVSGASSGSSR
jgi:hypothetical protein